DQMRNWVDNTVQRILSFKPSRVMEIGCGTGLLLFRIGPHCERYAGCDFSPAGLLQIEQELKRSQTMENVTLQQRVADDFDGIAPGSFDTVVLNSVVQYFPGAEYLLRVLERASEAVQSGGRIFVGDVRSLPLLETCLAVV